MTKQWLPYKISLMPILGALKTWLNIKMRTVEDIRRDKLIRLKEQCGSYAALGRKIKRERAQVWQWINVKTEKKTGKTKSISHKACRHIELCFGKDPGWMDQELEELEDLSLILGVDVKGLSAEKIDMFRLLLNVPDDKVKHIIYLSKAFNAEEEKSDKKNIK